MKASWHYWDTIEIESYFTVESRQKDKDVFLKTHLPMERILVDFCRDSVTKHGDFIGESWILEHLLKGNLNRENRIFFIVGETGCGKSELCQWLEYQMSDTNSNRVPIHISRSTTHINEISQILSNYLPLDHPARWQGNWLNLQQIPLQTLRTYLQTSLEIRALGHPYLTPEEKQACSYVIQAQAFQDFLGESLLHFDEAYEPHFGLRQELDFLPQSRYEAVLGGLLDKENLVLPSRHYSLLREWLLSSLREILQIGSLQQMLKGISQACLEQGKRPVLILEDITTFGFLRDDLFDYLFDLSSGHFDALIGLTTGFERTQLNWIVSQDDLTHLRERLAGRFLLSGDEGETYFLNGDQPVQLVKRYLQAVKHHVPEKIESYFDGLYPLTPALIQRIYQHLMEEGNPKHTPRLLLNFLLRDLLLSEFPPHLFLEKAHPYLNLPVVHFRVDHLCEMGMLQLLRWYGIETDEGVGVPLHLVDFWGYEIPREWVKGNMVEVPRLRISTIAKHQFGAEKAFENVQEDWEMALGDLQNWLTDDHVFPSREALKRGIDKWFRNFSDVRAIGHEMGIASQADSLYYTRSGEFLPVRLVGRSGDFQPPADMVHVVIEKNEQRFLLEELLIYHWQEHTDLRHFSQIADLLYWQQEKGTQFKSQLQANLQKHLNGLKWEEVVLMSWALIRNLMMGTPITAWDEIVHPFPLSFEERFTELFPWQPSNHSHPHYGLAKWGQKMAEQWEVYQNLFIGTFYLRDNFIDRIRYENILSHLDWKQVIEKLAHIDINRLRTLSFNVKRAKISLFDLLRPVCLYCEGLQGELKLDNIYHIQWQSLKILQQQLEDSSGIEKSFLYQSYERLYNLYGKAQLPWSEKNQQILEYIENLDFTSLPILSKFIDDCLGDPVLQVQPASAYQYLGLWHRKTAIFAHPFAQVVTHLTEGIQELERHLNKTYGSSRRSSQTKLASHYHQYKNQWAYLSEVLS
ncbi:MAG: hypothetical protein ACO1RX_08230 [Candidatus Sericytochromatia bacterium]